jgi:hypothetical protein
MVRLPVCLPVLAATILVWDSALRGQTHDASQILAAAREALGGERNLSAVKTLTATGRTRQLRGNNLVPVEFEIACELPDKFVRKDEFPAQDTDQTRSGFRGDEPIGSVPQTGGRSGSPAPQPNTTPRQDFARLMLGAFAASFSSYPLTFKYAAEAEAPEGTADVLSVSGPTNFEARFLVQRETHLPVMLIWQAPAAPARGAPAAPAEHRLYYADYRAVAGGVKWPFRIRHAVGGTTVEETTFDRVSINVRIDPKKFEPK